MDNDPGIVCFQHCGCKFFAFSCPHLCPKCNQQITDNYPFRVPFPFVRASQHPCSIVLKPTDGSFLRDYNNTCNLHIGVTNSKGDVFAYRDVGLRIEPGQQWMQCLTVHLGSQPFTALEWDNLLLEMLQDLTWSAECYKENDHNCYSFVLSFLKNIGAFPRSPMDVSHKERFCSYVLLPHTTAAAKYISVYRQVIAHGIYIHSNT